MFDKSISDLATAAGSAQQVGAFAVRIPPSDGRRLGVSNVLVPMTAASAKLNL